jgi:ribosomal protein S12 methylthiotransferase accessory factor
VSIETLRPVGPTPLADALPPLETFLSPYTGLVTALVEFAHAPDEMRLVSCGAVAADAAPLGGPRPTGSSGGSHWLRAAARAAALGEALERHSAAYVPPPGGVLATAAELGDVAVPPRRFALFHPAQHAADGFPFVPFTEHTRIRWVRGFSLQDGGEAWLPAQLVYLPVASPDADEELIAYATSSGVACAATPEEAVLSALLELIERDAFMLAWRNRLSLPRLDWSDDRHLSRLDDRYFARTGLRYSAVDLSVFFGVPAALGVVHGASGELGALGVGAGCGSSIEVAWRKALAEAFAVHSHVRDALYERPDLLGRRAAEIRSFDDHIFFYGSEERASAASFLDSSNELRSTREIESLEGAHLCAVIGDVVRRLDARGVASYAVDVTAPDVREAGVAVVRVVCPELCALDVVDTARFLGGSRLYRASFEHGLVSQPFELHDLNPDPHPFP